MTIPLYPGNLHRSYDCDYTVQHDSSSHQYHAEPSTQGRLLKPRMDVFEDPDTNVVIATLELPGVSRESIAISVYDNRLTISGDVVSSFGQGQGYILRERSTGPFARTLQLPANIPVESIAASLEDGVLTVSFPRLPLEDRSRRTNVSQRTELASHRY